VVLHVTNIPTPYRLPLYASIERQLREVGCRFHVCFLGRGNRVREWKIPAEQLAGIPHSFLEGRRDGAELCRTIDNLSPTVVVLAWAMDATALRALLHCRRRGIRCIVVSGENAHSASFSSHRRLRRIFRIPFFRLADGFIAYGTRAREYLCGEGVPPGRVTISLNVVDTGFFRSVVRGCRESGEASRFRSGYRRSNGEEFATHLLFVGELLERKGVLPTIEALAALKRDDVALHIVGSGEQEEEIHRTIERLAVTASVFLHGYRQKDELPLFYAAADLLLFPSLEEIFGLVLVEGAAAGLPIIASKYAGGTVDVVHEGRNGLVIDPLNAGEYRMAIERLLDDPDLRKRMGAASLEIVAESLEIDRSAGSYVAAVRKETE
jgi:glycosyltransferase involved in cell wall biosynthesis